MASKERGARFRTKPFSFAKSCSIGLRSGEVFREEDGGADTPHGSPDGLAFVRAEVVEDSVFHRISD
jgi:hypothetical protein